ncbi:MAG TPA: hypothetical protein PKE12_13050 [Kiritimatiellia bacterium]|nr:hypothetical protein [Kiritimatiellia bacterium]
MNIDKQIKWWSRRRDGELAAPRARKIDDMGVRPALVDEAEASWKALGDHLRSESIPTPPAEVMWNDVRRAIHQLRDDRRSHLHAAGRFRWDWAALAATAIFMLALGFFSLRITMPSAAYADPARVEWVEAELPGSTAMVYEDESSGAVVIWLVTPNGPPAGEGIQ